MKSHHLSTLKSLKLSSKLLISLWAISGLNLIGQSPESDEEIYQLSPFSVDASEDTGYTATSTLAGTRIRTNLKDLGAAISVVTAEFMEDVSATDAGTLLSYMTNMEVGGIHGNFSGAEPGGTSRIRVDEQRTNPQNNQRVRGLGSADLTRGLFLTDIGFDSYNSDRVTVSRGPNSLLFGIGSPGGVIDNGLKQAVQNSDFGMVSIRFDNYGSMRSEFDFNRSLIDERLALRIAGLNDDIEYKQEPAWNRDERIYGALDAVLLKNEKSEFLDATRFKANVEYGKSQGTPVEIIPPSIAYHGWFEPIPADIEQFTGTAPRSNVVAPSEGGTWNFQETYNPFEKNKESQINTNVHPSTFQQFAVVFADLNSAVPNLGTGDGLQGHYGAFPWSPSLDTLESTGLAGTPGANSVYGEDASGDTPVNNTIEYHANSPYGESYGVGFAVPSLMNRDVFDYRNQLFWGGIDRIDRKFSANNFAIEQGFFDNKIGVEFAHDDQHYETTEDYLFSGGAGGSTGSSSDIYVSIAEYLQNGQPNPNLGRAYSRVRSPRIFFKESDRETSRVTGFAKHDFSNNDGWLRHFGQHTVTGLFNDHTLDTHSTTLFDGFLSTDFDVRSAGRNQGLHQSGLAVNVIGFASDSLLGLNSTDDVRLNQLNVSRPQPGDTYRMLYAEMLDLDALLGIETGDLENNAPRRIEIGDAYVERILRDENVGKNSIESQALAWQGKLLGDHIVGLVGYREDDTVSFARAPRSEVGFDARGFLGRWNPQYTRLSKTPGLVETGDTTTWSVIGRYPESLIGELPWGMDLQAHYAESENFNPIGLRSNALGEAIGQPTGTTKEYGFLISSEDNSVSVKVNWFETRLNDVNAGRTTNVTGHMYGRIDQYREAELAGIPFSNHLSAVKGNPEDFPIQDYETYYSLSLNNIPERLRSVVNPRKEDTNGDGLWDVIGWDSIPNLRSTQDRVAEGFEIELTLNPVSGWRIIANASKQETVLSNTASVMIDVAEEFKQAYQSSRTFELRDLTSSSLRTNGDFWLEAQFVPLVGVASLDGTKSNEQREWRFTGVTNYEFQEGAFRGLSIGGAARWEDEAATGYVFALDQELGIPLPDVDRPFFDDGLFSGDLWVSYRRRIWDEKLDWKVQLNVRNAFGDDNDIPVKTNPDGNVAVIRIPNPRTVYLSNSFRF